MDTKVTISLISLSKDTRNLVSHTGIGSLISHQKVGCRQLLSRRPSARSRVRPHSGRARCSESGATLLSITTQKQINLCTDLIKFKKIWVSDNGSLPISFIERTDGVEKLCVSNLILFWRRRIKVRTAISSWATWYFRPQCSPLLQITCNTQAVSTLKLWTSTKLWRLHNLHSFFIIHV